MPTMPVFVFKRRCDIELETGQILAGQLVVDIHKRRKLSKKQQRVIGVIIKKLMEAAGAGKIPNDGFVYGWPDGRRPADADDTLANDELMNGWLDTRIVIGVRVDPRNDGMLRIDSDILRQAGLAHAPSGQH
jgi:hypothetical protein